MPRRSIKRKYPVEVITKKYPAASKQGQDVPS